jgi:glycosyltransferase involved in cell wall biosynthesis
LASLGTIAPALSRASGCIDGLELRVICDDLPHMPGVDVTLRRWSSETEAHDLAECDIGISWLPDHPWSRGKCGLKVLQYMAAGLPVVVNRMGVHCQMVRSGVEGVIVGEAPDLVRALQRLADDAGLRANMGQCGRSRVESEYSVARWTDLFIDVIRGRPVSERIANASARTTTC